jgi:cell division septum initiation protein DivIVA
MTIEEVEKKLSAMHFDSIVKSYCNKLNDIEKLKKENKELKQKLNKKTTSL